MRAIASMFTGLCLLSAQGCVRHAVAWTPEMHERFKKDPPPGMVEVDVISDDEDQVWDVYAGKEVVCSTPCTYAFRPRQELFLESRDGDAAYLPGFDADAVRARRAMLVAEGTSHGKQVNGIVFTTLGGMGLVTAITLVAVGCSDVAERGGMCTAGLITGGISAPLTAAAIWMLVDSAPKAHVLPIFKPSAGNGGPGAAVALVPNGVVGTF